MACHLFQNSCNEWLYNSDRMVLQLGSNGFAMWIEWFATWTEWYCNIHRTSCSTMGLETHLYQTYLDCLVMHCVWHEWFIGQSSQVKMHAQNSITPDPCASMSNTSHIIVSVLGCQPFLLSVRAEGRGKDWHHFHDYFCAPPRCATP